jgi:hypothetical protein
LDILLSLLKAGFSALWGLGCRDTTSGEGAVVLASPVAAGLVGSRASPDAVAPCTAWSQQDRGRARRLWPVPHFTTAAFSSTRLGDPAIIEEVTTTIVIEPSWTSVLRESGSYLPTREH